MTAEYNAGTERDACPVAAPKPSHLSLSCVLDQMRDEIQNPESPPERHRRRPASAFSGLS